MWSHGNECLHNLQDPGGGGKGNHRVDVIDTYSLLLHLPHSAPIQSGLHSSLSPQPPPQAGPDLPLFLSTHTQLWAAIGC